MSSSSSDAWWLRTEPVVAGPDGGAPPSALLADAPLTVDRDGVTLVLGPRAPAAGDVPADAPPVVASPVVASRGRRRRLAVGVPGVVLALGVASGAVLVRWPHPARRAGLATAGATVPVDPAGITATATSTQKPEGGITYDAVNTLDGELATAWNSNGTKHGKGTGISLVYTFRHALDLRDIVLRNGYQKLRPRPGRNPADLYLANQRLHRVRVVTDAGTWTWDLADTRAPQTFTGAAGRTGSVRLDVVSAYPSTTYQDVAVSEVSFTAALPSLDADADHQP